MRRTNAIKAMVTGQELLDIPRMAMADNRLVSDLVYVTLRRYMYGRVQPLPAAVQQIHGADVGHNGTSSAWADTQGAEA